MIVNDISTFTFCTPTQRLVYQVSQVYEEMSDHETNFIFIRTYLVALNSCVIGRHYFHQLIELGKK